MSQLEDDAVSYDTAHKRLRSRGSASLYSCVSCGGRAQQWAYVHGSLKERVDLSPPYKRYSPDVNDYEPRCITCHRRQDASRRNEGFCRNGHKFSGANVYVKPNGNAHCVSCNRDAATRYYRRKSSVLN